MKVLIVDLSGKSGGKILKAEILRNFVQISAGLYFDFFEETDALDTLAKKIKEEKLKSLPVYLIPSEKIIHSEIFELPVMPKKELKMVLEREVQKNSKVSGPLVLDYHLNKEEIKGQTGFKVTVLFAQSEKLNELMFRLKKLEIEPVKIIPQLSCFFSLKSKEGRDKATVFFEISSDTVSLHMCANNTWMYKRDFVFSHTKTDQISEDNLKRISVELNRTFQYFKQKNRKIEITHLVLYGTNNCMTEVQEYLTANFSMDIKQIDVDNFNDNTQLPKKLENIQEFLRFFTIPIGIMQLVAEKCEINLIPVEFREKETLPKRLLGLGISAGILIVIMAIAIFYFEGIKNGYKAQIRDKNSFFSMVDFKEVERFKNFIKKLPEDEQIQAQKTMGLSSNPVDFINLAKTIRKEFYQKEYYVNLPLQFSYTAAEFLKKLSGVVSKEIKLSDLTILPNNMNIDFSMNGVISEEEGLLEQFLKFYNSIEAFDNILGISFSKIQVNLNENNHSVNSSEESSRDKNQNEQLFFSIRGTLELE